MANPEHLEILKQGVDEWNRWRKDYPKIRESGESVAGGRRREGDAASVETVRG